MNDALVVFARAPRVGHTKTRLIQALGALPAAELYAGLLARTLHIAEAVDPIQRYLYVDAPAARDYFAPLLAPDRWRVEGQVAGDLGLRMSDALVRALSQHARVILIGSDIVDLQARDLIDALQRLAARDEAVIGPAADGGYWLIGLRQPQPALFADLQWGEPHIFQATVQRFAALGVRWSTLPVRHDIDTPSDVAQWRAALGALTPSKVRVC